MPGDSHDTRSEIWSATWSKSWQGTTAKQLGAVRAPRVWCRSVQIAGFLMRFPCTCDLCNTQIPLDDEYTLIHLIGLGQCPLSGTTSVDQEGGIESVQRWSPYRGFWRSSQNPIV